MCTDIENCIYSEYYECVECKESYFYDINDKKCKNLKIVNLDMKFIIVYIVEMILILIIQEVYVIAI